MMKKRWLRKSIVVMVLVGVVVALAVGVVLAGENDSEHPRRGPKAARGLAQKLMEATGLTPEEFRAELEADKTLAQIAQENGVDPDAFVADVLDDMEAKLDEAVANGRLEQTRANEILARVSELLPQIMDGTFEPPTDGQRPGGQHQGQRPGPRKIGGSIIGQLMEATGLTPEAFRAELQAGKTLAQIAQENGIDPDALVADVLDEMEAKLDEAVAEGRLSQERAGQILAQAAEALPQLMDRTFDFQNQDGNGPRGGAFGPGRQFGGRQGGPPVGAPFTDTSL